MFFLLDSVVSNGMLANCCVAVPKAIHCNKVVEHNALVVQDMLSDVWISEEGGQKQAAFDPEDPSYNVGLAPESLFNQPIILISAIEIT